MHHQMAFHQQLKEIMVEMVVEMDLLVEVVEVLVVLATLLLQMQ